MSRYLAEALEANAPSFRHRLDKLERSSGHPNHDLRLTSEIMSSIRSKVESLGLDPDDTTAEELYSALNQKLLSDDKKLVKLVRSSAASRVNAEANIIDGLKLLLEQLNQGRSCYVIKNAVLKRQLSQSPPKKTMKNLGYRSLASMLKHEPMSLILLAINNFESSKYINDFYQNYAAFKPTDFEERKLVILAPTSTKWQTLLSSIQEVTDRQLISCYELGSLILMPLKNSLEPGQLSANLVLMLSEVNKIISTSTYLKLYQVSRDFGQKLYQVAEQEPLVKLNVVDQPIPWHLLQKVISAEKIDLNIPHLNQDDLSLNKVIEKIGELVPDYKFWQSTDFLGLVNRAEATSLNILDVANNLSSKLDFGNRQTSYLKQSLWQEIISRYIGTQAVNDSLPVNLTEPAFETA